MLYTLLAALVAVSAGFAPGAPSSRPVVQRAASPVMEVEQLTRAAVLARAGAGVAALTAAASGASAKAGQFAKASLFGFDTSSPYVGEKVVPGTTTAGSAYVENTQATYGYKPTGEFLAKGYTQDVTREKKVFEKTSKLMSSLQSDIDSKTWWKVRDQLRGTDVYSMRSSMLSINGALPDDKKAAAAKAYKKYWQEVEALDLACVKKEQALATKKNADMVEALKAYTATTA